MGGSLAVAGDASGPLMTEASQIYLGAKGKNRPLTFSQAVNRSVRYLVSVVGDKPVDSYERQWAALALRTQVYLTGLGHQRA